MHTHSVRAAAAPSARITARCHWINTFWYLPRAFRPQCGRGSGRTDGVSWAGWGQRSAGWAQSCRASEYCLVQYCNQKLIKALSFLPSGDPSMDLKEQEVQLGLNCSLFKSCHIPSPSWCTVLQVQQSAAFSSVVLTYLPPCSYGQAVFFSICTLVQTVLRGPERIKSIERCGSIAGSGHQISFSVLGVIRGRYLVQAATFRRPLEEFFLNRLLERCCTFFL